MQDLDFIIPIKWNNPEKGLKQHIIEGIDGYFSPLGLKVAVVTKEMIGDSQLVKIGTERYKPIKLISTIIKIITYATVVIPLIMYAVKRIFRATHKFCFQFDDIKGIPNIGNSCYMNSTLQLLLASPAIIQRIKTHVVDEQLNDSDSRQIILDALKLFVEAIEDGNQAKTKEAAVAFRKTIFDSNFDFDFDNNHLKEQQDAARFADIIFRVLEWSTAYKKTLTAGDDRGEPTEIRTSSLITMQTDTSFQDLINLEFSKKNVADKWRSHTKHNQQLSIDCEPPENLVFTLNRFKRDNYGKLSKIRDRVPFPEDGILDLSTAFDCEENVRYEVISTVNHYGSLNYGHYISYTKRKNKWYLANDSKITKEKPLLQDAYIVLLKKV